MSGLACCGLAGVIGCAGFSRTDSLEQSDGVDAVSPHHAFIPEEAPDARRLTDVGACLDDRDLLAGLPGRPVSAKRAAALRSRFGEARLAALEADTSLVIRLEQQESEYEVVVTLVREHESELVILAHGSFPAEPVDAGEGWGVDYKLMGPEGASTTPLHVPGVEQVFAIAVQLSYWGGAGAGLATQDHHVAYLVARRGGRLQLLLATIYQADWVEYPGCEQMTNDCMEQEVPQPHSHRSELRATGCPPTRVILREQGPGPSVHSSRWNARLGHFQPLYLRD